MIGEETAHRPAVLWEIREAHRQDKRVLGIRIHSREKHPIPQPMVDRGDPVLGWELKKIKGALEGAK